MIKTGELLRKERERQGISIEDVAITTRINLKTLVALESGDLESLPARPFIRGFVKSYAKFLKMDEKLVLETFQAEMGSTKPPAGSAEGSNEGNEGESAVVAAPTASNSIRPTERVAKEHLKQNNTVKIVLISGVVILLTGLIFATIQVVEKYDRESQIVTDLKDVDSDEESVSEIPLETDSEETEETESIEPPVDSAVTATTTSTTVTQSTLVTTTTAKTPTAPSTTVPVTITTVTQTTLKPKQQLIDVVIEALDSITIGYRIDDGGLVTKKMKPDEVLNIRGTTSLVIDFSDGGAVNVIYNGKDLGQPGNLGQPHKLKLPR